MNDDPRRQHHVVPTLHAQRLYTAKDPHSLATSQANTIAPHTPPAATATVHPPIHTSSSPPQPPLTTTPPRPLSLLTLPPTRPTLLSRPTQPTLEDTPTSSLRPLSQPSLSSLLQVRGAKRDTFNPSHRVRKRRHGFLARLRSRTGRMVLMRRKLKGRNTLSH